MLFISLEVALMAGFTYILYQSRFALKNKVGKLERTIQESAKKKVWNNVSNLLIVCGFGKFQAQEWWDKSWKQFVILFILSCTTSLIGSNWNYVCIPFLFAFAKYYFILKMARVRKDKILKRIPFVLDILILNLESGLDFIASLEEIANMDDDHPFLDEIQLTLQSIQLGESRAKAFETLANRTRVPELAHLAGTIRQSEVMGSSLTELLRLQSQEIRYRIFRQAESEAQKSPVKILIPMMLFIFPVVFIILFVPIGIQLFENFK